MRQALMFAVALVGGVPVLAQIPADVSMGFSFRGVAAPVVAGEVTEHLNDRLAVLGGAYWGSTVGASTVGFYVGPRLYTEPAGRFRPFGELAFGFSQSSRPARLLAHALTFTPAMGVEVGIGTRTRVRAAAGYGLTLGGVGDGTGFSATTALVLIPARKRQSRPQMSGTGIGRHEKRRRDVQASGGRSPDGGCVGGVPCRVLLSSRHRGSAARRIAIGRRRGVNRLCGLGWPVGSADCSIPATRDSRAGAQKR